MNRREFHFSITPTPMLVLTLLAAACGSESEPVSCEDGLADVGDRCRDPRQICVGARSGELNLRCEGGRWVVADDVQSVLAPADAGTR